MKEKRLSILLNFGPWVYIFFNILCDTIESTHEVLSLYTKSMMIASRKGTCEIV